MEKQYTTKQTFAVNKEPYRFVFVSIQIVSLDLYLINQQTQTLKTVYVQASIEIAHKPPSTCRNSARPTPPTPPSPVADHTTSEINEKQHGTYTRSLITRGINWQIPSPAADQTSDTIASNRRLSAVASGNPDHLLVTLLSAVPSTLELVFQVAVAFPLVSDRVVWLYSDF